MTTTTATKTVSLAWNSFRFFTDIKASRAFRFELDRAGHLSRTQVVGNGILVGWDHNGN
jgi:hypothetical protein